MLGLVLAILLAQTWQCPHVGFPALELEGGFPVPGYCWGFVQGGWNKNHHSNEL